MTKHESRTAAEDVVKYLKGKGHEAWIKYKTRGEYQ